MSLPRAVITASKVAVASYRILATSILAFYLIRETVRREKDGRKYAGDGRGPRP